MNYEDKNIIAEEIEHSTGENVKFYLIDIKENSMGNRLIMVLRDGSSGKSYTVREIKIRPLSYRYICEGDSPLEVVENAMNNGEYNWCESFVDERTSAYAIAKFASNYNFQSEGASLV